jgi:hypothetical protein
MPLGPHEHLAASPIRGWKLGHGHQLAHIIDERGDVDVLVGVHAEYETDLPHPASLRGREPVLAAITARTEHSWRQAKPLSGHGRSRCRVVGVEPGGRQIHREAIARQLNHESDRQADTHGHIMD